MDRSNIAPLRLVAEYAGEGQVVLLRRAIMLLADNVIYRTAVESVILGDQAILANPFGSGRHQTPQFRADVREGHVPLLAVEVLAGAGLR